MKGSKRKRCRAGTWELRIDSGRGALTGKPQQRSVVFEGTSREADAALAEPLTAANRGHVAVNTRTVADAVEEGLRQAVLEGLEQTTIRHYRTSANCHILPALGDRRLSHLRAEHLDRFYGALVEKGYARSTVRSCHVLTCRVLEQARRSGWVPVNVARDARPPRQSTSNPSAGADRDCQGHGRGGGHVEPNLATLLVLAADTGARWGELCALRWRHLDEQAGTIRIEAANR